MKQKILGTPIGRWAAISRDASKVLRALVTTPDSVGSMLNDNLASDLVARLCRPGMTFLDVGSHIGSVVADVLHHDSSVNVIAIEAIPEKVTKLREKFPQITIHECAVGDREGTASFFVDTELSGYSSLSTPDNRREARNVEITVQIKTLDGLIDADDVDVIKIDVEGAELGVLRGANALCAKHRPTIMFESGPPEIDTSGYTKEAMWAWFDEAEYDVLVPHRLAHYAPPLSLEMFTDSHFYPRRTTNYFAVARERRDEVRNRTRDLLGIPPADFPVES